LISEGLNIATKIDHEAKELQQNLNGSMPTTFRYIGQRQEPGIGLYYYGAMWYDAGLGRFVSADTIVPGTGNPQAWDRYAYVNNNPLRYIDPSGHVPLIDGVYSVEYATKHAEEVGEDPSLRSDSHRYIPPAIYSKAKIISVGGIVGVGPWFYMGGVDVVINGHQVGFFTVSAAGPGVGGHKISGVPTNANDEESTFVTPQLDGAVTFGNVYGDSVMDEVSNYGGPALAGGGSIGPGSAEGFTSVDPDTGMPNMDITGYTIGLGYGLVPSAEIHVFYLDAIYQSKISSSLTRLARFLGIVN
jgi:RHS repeat-associated protein